MFRKDEGVSPVIGIMIMVVITIILAAVISVIVFGSIGNLNTPVYSKTITVRELTTVSGNAGYRMLNMQQIGVIDTEGQGYVMVDALGSRLVDPTVNGTYNISYYVESKTNLRMVMKMSTVTLPTDTTLDHYRCSITDGVCK